MYLKIIYKENGKIINNKKFKNKKFVFLISFLLSIALIIKITTLECRTILKREPEIICILL